MKGSTNGEEPIGALIIQRPDSSARKPKRSDID
jgi:hypothetical protein